MTEFDYNDLPAFREWRSGFQPPPDSLAYLAENLNVAGAFFFAQLMAPDLVLERGCVILRDRYSPENFQKWWSLEAGDTAAIERSLNHLHLWDIFEPEGDVEEHALEALAVRIARSWKLHAAVEFPDRSFRTDITDEYGPTVVMTSELKNESA